jgi:hypothetical protein
MFMTTNHYQQPDFFTRQIMNRLVMRMTRSGLSIRGSRVLEVPGRNSGVARRVPVNPLEVDGVQYLVAPRGETQWVRNARAAGQVTLIKGRRRQAFALVELGDDQKPALLRSYLTKWKFEVGMFFEGVGPDSTDEEIAAIAPKHPVFRLTPVAA